MEIRYLLPFRVWLNVFRGEKQGEKLQAPPSARDVKFVKIKREINKYDVFLLKIKKGNILYN